MPVDFYEHSNAAGATDRTAANNRPWTHGPRRIRAIGVFGDTTDETYTFMMGNQVEVGPGAETPAATWDGDLRKLYPIDMFLLQGESCILELSNSDAMNANTCQIVVVYD